MSTFSRAIIAIVLSVFVMEFFRAHADGPSNGGAPGTPGSLIWMSAGVPSQSIGANTDIDVDTLTANVYQKSGGAWTGPTMNLQGPQGATGSGGTNGTNGTNGATGATGATGGFTAYGQPATRTFALATAYQCSDNTKPCLLTVTLTSTASITLTAGTTNTADVVIGTTSGIATSGGTRIAQYSNSLTGSLVVGANINTASNSTYTISMPAGGFFAMRQTAGTGGAVTVVNSSVEQTVS